VTPTPTATPTPTCIAWAYVLREEFVDPELTGWRVDLGNGRVSVENSVISLRENPFWDFTFPIVWRNDGFPAEGDLVFETRFHYSHVTPFGVTIGVGSLPYHGNRYVQDKPPIPGVEDILSIHQFDEEFRIKLLDRIVWTGPQLDESWHQVRLELEGDRYMLWVDGVYVAEARSNVRPISIYLGNPSIQFYSGPWTWLHVDYIWVSHCIEWGYTSLPMPALLKRR